AGGQTRPGGEVLSSLPRSCGGGDWPQGLGEVRRPVPPRRGGQQGGPGADGPGEDGRRPEGPGGGGEPDRAAPEGQGPVSGVRDAGAVPDQPGVSAEGARPEKGRGGAAAGPEGARRRPEAGRAG